MAERVLTAIWKIDAVELICPRCADTFPEPGGSLFSVLAELPPAGIVLRCEKCGQGVRSSADPTRKEGSMISWDASK